MCLFSTAHWHLNEIYRSGCIQSGVNIWKRWWNYVLTMSMTDRYTVHPVQRDIPVTSGSLLCVHVSHVFYLIWIIDCTCKWQALCTHITHRHKARWARPDLLTYQHMRMMDTHVGPIVDIHAQLIIHELHCAWISLFSLRLTEGVQHRSAPRRYLAFTLQHVCVCVSNGQWHPLQMIRIQSVH